jgi:PAS domain S-box-containing protein
MELDKTLSFGRLLLIIVFSLAAIGLIAFGILSFKDELCYLLDESYMAWEITIGIILLIILSAGAAYIYYRNRHKAESKQSNEALLKEKETFYTYLENAPYGMVLILQNGRINYINRKFRKVFGYEIEDIPDGRTWSRKAFPDAAYRHEVISAWKDDFIESNTAEQKPRVFNAACKDGSTKTINFITVKLAGGDYLMSCEDITERKRAEERLSESEERLRLVTDNARDMLWIMDLGLRITWISPSVVSTRDYTLAELAEIPVYQQITPVSLARMMQLMAVHITPARLSDPYAEIVMSGEFEFYRKDGSTFWADSVIVLLRDKDRKPTGFLSVGRDITVRKRAEEKLRESEEKLSLVMDGVQALLAYVDADMRFVYVNKAYADWYGLSKEDLVGKRISELLHEEIFKLALPHYQAALSGQIVSFENKAYDKEGQERFVSVRLVPNRRGNLVTGFFASIFDITEIKKTEDALSESEERYRVAIEGANDGVAIVKNDIHVYVNQQFLNIFGYSSLDEIVGRERNIIVHPDCHELVTGYAKARQRGEYAPTRYEFKGIRKDGSAVDIEVSVNTILHKGEKAILAYLRDITDRRQAEEDLRESKERLFQQLIEKSPDAHLVIDESRHYVDCNQAALELLRMRSREQLLGLTPVDISPECQPNGRLSGEYADVIISRIIEEGTYWFEWVHRKADGEEFQAEVEATVIPHHGRRLLHAVIRDITERKQAEEASL